MTGGDQVERTIDGTAKSIAQLLQGQKYSIDYYQREYKWESKQLAELVADLTTKFLDVHDDAHARKDVAKYPGYYLGSVIMSKKGARPFIVDGQQRLTTLTLMLTFLRRLQEGRADQVNVDDLIYSEQYGEKSFNLDVKDRLEAMTALFEAGSYDPPRDAPESVHTLVDRYEEIDAIFPDELRGTALPYFIDWLKGRVQLVEITAYTDDDAYAIFETMNDRGLRLTPADMLKGYLLANIAEGDPRTRANDLWRKRMRELNDLSEDGGADFLKTWLRSQYSMKIRERQKAARPEDWDRIGTEFHRWLRGAHETIDLNSRDDFERFVMRDFAFYSDQFEQIIRAKSESPVERNPLRFIGYNQVLRFTLQDQLLLAPVRIGETRQTVEKKFELVGRYVDILLAWRIWNFRATDYSTMQYAMFTIMKDIRRLGVTDLATTLHDRLGKETQTFDTQRDLFVHQQNRKQLHHILARITDYITVQSGEESNYSQLINAGSTRYEVEHIWANRPERHVRTDTSDSDPAHEFPHETDFARHRNRIGGLLLLPKQFNSSYNDATYEEKLPQYFKENLLARSLHPLSYENHPGFKRFIERSGLPFRPYDHVRAADINERGELYRQIAWRVWNPDDLLAVGTQSA